ncbi:uncharacterized protein LOC126267710 [Schistocerca gregaria]|uniref:uncharacterized protein LOC126267710 n=1 Tax=Schistocerca gregaria TaxID=7010 RepID=UPI00211EB695|nr:uncharacterized protein LOC126267710 [Schistocerca gregaria]
MDGLWKRYTEIRYFCFLCKVFGTCPISFEKKEEKITVTFKARLYCILLGLLTLFSALYTFLVRLPESYKTVENLAKYSDACNIFFAAAAALTCILRSSTLKQRHIESFCIKIISVDGFLYEDDGSEYLGLATRLVLCVVAVTIYSVVLFGHLTWLMLPTMKFSFLLPICVMQFMSNVTILQYLFLNMALKMRFSRVNRYILQLFFLSTRDAEGELDIKISKLVNETPEKKDLQCDDQLFLRKTFSSLHSEAQIIVNGSRDVIHCCNQVMVTEEDAKKLKNLRKIYCLLVEIGKAVNAAYGVQNLVEVVSCFVSTVTYIYISVVVYLDLKPVWPGIPRSQVITMFSLWTGLMAGRLLATAYSSDMVVQETARTQRLVQKLMLLPMPARSGCPDELQLFGEQMARSQLRYSAAGLFTLDLSLLRSFTATVTTYVVILVQFGLSGASKQQNSSAVACRC